MGPHCSLQNAVLRRLLVSFLKWQVRGCEEMVWSCASRGLDWTFGRVSSWRLEKVTRGNRRAPTLEGIWKMWGYGTTGYGLMMGLNRSGWWLKLVILKVFSHLDGSMTVWFYNSMNYISENMYQSWHLLYYWKKPSVLFLQLDIFATCKSWFTR